MEIILLDYESIIISKSEFIQCQSKSCELSQSEVSS